MPYFISDNTDCPDWAVVKEDGSVVSCQDSKQSAIDQMVALSLAEELEPGGELRAESGPPAIIADIDDVMITADGLRDEKVYAYLDSFDDTEVIIVTDRLASDRSNTVAQLEDLDIEYDQLFMRPNNDTSSASFKKSMAEKLLNVYNVMVAIEANADIRTIYADLGITAISAEDVPTVPSDEPSEDSPDDTPDMIPDSESMIRMKTLANKLIARIESEETMTKDNKWLDVARAIALKIDGPKAQEPEVRTNSVDFEVRAEGDGMTFTGYASVFNSPSQDLGGFIEYVAPGAFKRSLQSRNEVKLLWNHDSGEPLASLRGGTMQLVEDDRGLKVTAQLPNTTRGRDIAELLRTKVIDSMSFGFNVIKDTWSRDGQTRTLDSVRLFEVSVVSFPAYEATTAQVRSQPTINPDQLADALLKLESGEELDEANATLITEVVNKLKANPGVEEVIDNGLDLLDLKKKQFDLLLKRI
jgi:HK97 family phage prohead protease